MSKNVFAWSKKKRTHSQYSNINVNDKGIEFARFRENENERDWKSERKTQRKNERVLCEIWFSVFALEFSEQAKSVQMKPSTFPLCIISNNWLFACLPACQLTKQHTHTCCRAFLLYHCSLPLSLNNQNIVHAVQIKTNCKKKKIAATATASPTPVCTTKILCVTFPFLNRSNSEYDANGIAVVVVDGGGDQSSNLETVL